MSESVFPPDHSDPAHEGGADSGAFDHRALLRVLPDLPGVYRMLSISGEVLYVGKAKNLKKRLASYFRGQLVSPRIALMVSQIARVETTVTRSESEALLLENNLIKRLRPRYNIVFRDDKSYPYIAISKGLFPRISLYRGRLDNRYAEYFGPYPSVSAVHDSVHLLQKMFRLRTCEDSVFSHRSRPCLLYQIKRCSGPCVDLVTAEAYAKDVQLARLFLQGKKQEITQWLEKAIEMAADVLDFEQAAVLRDQLYSLRQIQAKQYVESRLGEDVDVLVAVEEGGLVCVNLAMVRGGRHLGDHTCFPGGGAICSVEEAILAFLQQHYLEHFIPECIVVSPTPSAVHKIATALAQLRDCPVRILGPKKAMQKMWVEMAIQNARLAITARQASLSLQGKRQVALSEILGLDNLNRIECFDISHTQGEATVAACVVYQGNAMKKSEYRRFNIRAVTPGDDCAAIRQAVLRRYERRDSGEGVLPDLILIDGGHTQLAAAISALQDVGLGDLSILGIAKGEGRKPGLETLVFQDGRDPLQLPPGHPGLHLLQEVRDEAHRFAIAGHRAQRGKARLRSRLEEIDGVGPKRRKALLVHLGGLQGVIDASEEQLMRVPGVSQTLAEKIYMALRVS